MEIRCPFIDVFYGEVTCPYMNGIGYCDEIEVNPGNSDAWCHEMIEKGLKYCPPAFAGAE